MASRLFYADKVYQSGKTRKSISGGSIPLRLLIAKSPTFQYALSYDIIQRRHTPRAVTIVPITSCWNEPTIVALLRHTEYAYYP